MESLVMAVSAVSSQPLSMFIVILAALLIPILMARFQITGVPTAVAEIIVGVILGKSGLQVVNTTTNLSLLSSVDRVNVFVGDGDRFFPVPAGKKQGCQSRGLTSQVGGGGLHGQFDRGVWLGFRATKIGAL